MGLSFGFYDGPVQIPVHGTCAVNCYLSAAAGFQPAAVLREYVCMQKYWWFASCLLMSHRLVETLRIGVDGGCCRKKMISGGMDFPS